MRNRRVLAGGLGAAVLGVSATVLATTGNDAPAGRASSQLEACAPAASGRPTRASPPADLMRELAVLRRPARERDRLPPPVRASLTDHPAETSSRLLGRTASGTRVFLVPTHVALPDGAEPCVPGSSSRPDGWTLQVASAEQSTTITPDALRRYGLLLTDTTSSETDPPDISAVVPDGVQEVELRIPGAARFATRAVENFAALRVPRSATDFDRVDMTWRDPSGRVVGPEQP